MPKQNVKLMMLLLVVIITTTRLKAQTDLEAKAPTLQVGLDGFSFANGSLDAKLIMEMVAEKQKDLKVKAIQNLFLKKVENTGGTVYSFVDNVVRELVYEPDPQVRAKKTLENTVNLVFTASFFHFYLSSLDKNSPERKTLVRLAFKINHKLDPVALYAKEKISLADFSNAKRTSHFFSDEDAVKVIALLFDMCSKAISEDTKLKQLGLMQVAYSETYEYMNLYNKLTRYSAKKNQLPDSIRLTKFQKAFLNKAQEKMITSSIPIVTDSSAATADSVFKHIKQTLLLCTDYIGVVNYLADQKTFRFNVEKISDGVSYDPGATPDFDLDKLKSIQSSLKLLIQELESQLINKHGKLSAIAGSTVLIEKLDTTLTEDIRNLVKIYFYIDKAIKQIEAIKSDTNKPDSTKHSTYADILYALSSDFTPLLKNQSFRSIEYLTIINSLNSFTHDLFTNIINKNPVLSKNIEKIPSFLQLTAKLYQFDRSATISEYMKLASDIGTIFPDDNIKNALSSILRFVNDYSVIEKRGDKEVFAFNVESFLYKLQTIKPYKLTRIQFLFTVGVNNAMFSSDFTLPDTAVITRNLSFVGEKIGVKYILWDRAFARSRNPGETFQIYGKNSRPYIRDVAPKEPVVSNFHFIAYGSGILYSLVNTKTQKEFNMPIIGIGAGVTFYNGLDFNISYGVPILASEAISSTHSFVNVGFDIQFIEYYDRLMEKRKNNQTQKRLAEAKLN